MKLELLAFLLIALSQANASREDPMNGLNWDIPADVYGNFTEYAERKGFTTETHETTTEDGYILVMFRITGIKGGQSNVGKPVAIMAHGLLASADSFIDNDEDKAPGFMMVRAGFDCWFFNARGNKYSKYNTKLSPNDEAFWEFTWQHMGQYDVPATVDYVLAQTGKKALTWIGHSQGNMVMFAQLAENPDFAEKINLFVPLAPVGSLVHSTSALLKVLDKYHAGYILQFIGYHDFLHFMPKEVEFTYLMCHTFPSMCLSGVQSVADKDLSVDNTDRFPIIFAHMPAGTSTRNMIHFEQMPQLKEPGFCKYDYGKKGNIQHYNQETAPCYDLSKIKAKIAWWVGNQDHFCEAGDVAWLKSQLNPDILVKAETMDRFGHFTVVWGKNMTWWEDVIATAKEYSAEDEDSVKFLNS